MIDDSDLIEFNVMGTLNSSLMFYRGLSDGGAYEATEDEIFADVWSQEEATRDSSAEWLGAFLMVAYEPLDPRTDGRLYRDLPHGGGAGVEPGDFRRLRPDV